MAGLNTDIRIFFRIIGETIKGINRTQWMNLVIITTMAAILSIFACLFRTSLFISHFVSELGDSIEISIYLKPKKDAKQLSEKILKYKNIKDLKIITKEEAWKDFKKQHNMPEINNPLPDTIRVQLIDRAEVDKFIEAVKKMNEVEDVQYAKQLAAKVGQIGHFVNTAAIIVVILLGGLTLSVINNTVHLVIESRKQEIDIMRIMGVSNWYIRAPYIFQGSFYGFCGSLLAIIPLFVLHSYLLKLVDYFYIPLLPVNTGIVILTVLTMGLTVGALGSVVAVRKYLKV